MASKWKREDTEKLIYAMQQHPSLYNIKSAEYLDRTKKAQAFNEILEDLNKSIPNITLDDLKQKWRNVRSQYVQELRMMNLSKKSGSGKSDIYIPKLWCFSQLAFLKSNTKMRISGDNLEDNKLEDEENCPENIILDESFSEEPPKKKNKRVGDVNVIRNDLSDLKQKISERKKERKFAWLGNLVTVQMDEIDPEDQADAAWQVQCLMRKLIQKNVRSQYTGSDNCEKDILELSMDGVFEEDDFILVSNY